MRETTPQYLACARSTNRYPIVKMEWADPILRWEAVLNTPRFANMAIPVGACHHAAVTSDGAIWSAIADGPSLKVYRITNPDNPDAWLAQPLYTTYPYGSGGKPLVIPNSDNTVTIHALRSYANAVAWYTYTITPSGQVSLTSYYYQTTIEYSSIAALALDSLSGANFLWATMVRNHSGCVISLLVRLIPGANYIYEYDNAAMRVGDGGFAPPNPLYTFGAGIPGRLLIYPGYGLQPVWAVMGAGNTWEICARPLINTDVADSWYRMMVWDVVQSPLGEFWATATVVRTGSSGMYPVQMDCILRSVDGKHWSLDRYSFIAANGSGGSIVARGDYLYYIGQRVYRARKNALWDGSGWTEITPSAWSYDSSTAWNASLVSATIPRTQTEAIPPGALLRTKAGYRDENGDHLVQISIGGIDTIAENDTPGEEEAGIRARDLGMRLLYDHAVDYDAVYESRPVGFTDGTNIAPLYPVTGQRLETKEEQGRANSLVFQSWNRAGVFFSAVPQATSRPQVTATFMFSTESPTGPVGLNVMSSGNPKIASASGGYVSGNVLYAPGADLYSFGPASQSPRTTGDWSLWGFTCGRYVGYIRASAGSGSAYVTKDLKGEVSGAADTGCDLGDLVTYWRIGLDGKPLPPFYGAGAIIYARDEYNWVAVGLDIIGKRLVAVACVGASTEKGIAYGWALLGSQSISNLPISQQYAYRIHVRGNDRGRVWAFVAVVDPSTGQMVPVQGTTSMIIDVPPALVCKGKTGLLLCQPVAESIIENLPSDTEYAVRAWGMWGTTTQALYNNSRLSQDDWRDFAVGKRVVIDDGSGDPEICILQSLAQTNWKSCYLHSYAKTRAFYSWGNPAPPKVWFAHRPGNRNDYAGWEGLNNGPKCLYVLNGIGIGLYALCDRCEDTTVRSPQNTDYPVLGCALVDAGAFYEAVGSSRWGVFERIGPVMHRIDSGSVTALAYESASNFAEAGLMPTFVLYEKSGQNPRYYSNDARTHYSQSRVRQHYNEKLYVLDFMAAALEYPILTLDDVIRDLMAKCGILQPQAETIFTATVPDNQSVDLNLRCGDIGNVYIHMTARLPSIGSKITITHHGRGLVLEIIVTGSFQYCSVYLKTADGTLLDYNNISSPSQDTTVDVAFVGRFVHVGMDGWRSTRTLRACRVLETTDDSVFETGKGRVSVSASGGAFLTISIPELYHIVDVVPVSCGQSVASLIREAIHDLRVVITPTSDGSLKYSLLDYPDGSTLRDDLGTITDAALSPGRVSIFGLSRVRTDRVPTYIQAIGLETTNYVDENAARMYGLLFVQNQTPSLTEDAALADAKRAVWRAVSYALPISITTAAQPHWEIEDLVSVTETGKTYVVDRVVINGSPGRMEATAELRPRVS